MKTIVDYKLVGADPLERCDGMMVKDVKELLAKGWHLLGAPFACGDEVIQAMVLEKEAA